MLSARNKDGYVIAWQVTKAYQPFYCPACNNEVYLKKGPVRYHHFAHKPPTECEYGKGESAEHLKAKREIYEALRGNPRVTSLQLERYFGEVRPDIFFHFDNNPVAIEVQISALNRDTIVRRTQAYARRNIHLLWTSPFPHTIVDAKRYTPRFWEKYLHALYFGKVYYWLSGETLLPVHFDEYELFVEYGEDEDGRQVGGYFKRSKRWRTPRFQDKVTITNLAPLTRKAWSQSTISLPAARLWSQPFVH